MDSNLNASNPLDSLYDFVDYLKYKNDTDDISLPVIQELRNEYNNIKSTVNGPLSNDEVVKKLTFVMKCEYQTLLKKFLQDKVNLNKLVQDNELLRMLTESVVDISEPSRLEVPTSPNDTTITRNKTDIHDDYSHLGLSEKNRTKSNTEMTAYSKQLEMEKLLINKSIMSFSYHLQKISAIAKINGKEKELANLINRLSEFESNFDNLNEYDDVILEDESIKDVKTICAIINSDAFNSLFENNTPLLIFCRKFQTFALKMTLNHAKVRNQIIIDTNPDIEYYISMKGSQQEQNYGSSRNMFPARDSIHQENSNDVNAKSNSLPVRPFSLSRHEAPGSTFKDIKDSGKPVLFSSFFDKERKSRAGDSRASDISDIRDGDGVSPLLILKDTKTIIYERDESFEDQKDDARPSETIRTNINVKRDANDSFTDVAESKLIVNKQNQSLNCADSKLLSPISNSNPTTPKSKNDTFVETFVNKDILISEINKTSKVSLRDLMSQPNSKNVSQDKEILRDIIREVRKEQEKDALKVKDSNGNTPKNVHNEEKKDQNGNQFRFVDPSIINSFRNLEFSDQIMEIKKKNDNDNDKSDELDENELEAYFGKNLKEQILSRHGLSQENVFMDEEKFTIAKTGTIKSSVNMKSLLDKNYEVKIDVSRSQRTNHTEASGFDTTGFKGNHFETIMSQKLNGVQDQNYEYNIFTRDFSKIVEKFKRNPINGIEYNKCKGYVDITFEPTTASMFENWNSPQLKDWRWFEWRRVSNIYSSDYTMIFKNEGVQLLDASISNPDLLTIFLSLQRYDSMLIDAIIHDHKPALGKFAVKSLVNGDITYLDDFLPVKVNYTSSETTDFYTFPFIAPIIEPLEVNIFFSVVEKYCAKKLGSYETLQTLPFEELIKFFSDHSEEIDLTLVREVDKKLLQNFLMDLYEDFKDEARIIYFIKKGEKVKFCKYIKKEGFEFLLEDFTSQVNYSFNVIAHTYEKMVVVKYNM